MNQKIARYLKDFGAPLSAAPEPHGPQGHAPLLSFDLSTFAEPEAEPEFAVDVEAELRATLGAEHEAAMAELAGRHAEELAAAAESHAKELAEVKELYEKELVALMAQRIAEMTDVVSRAVTDAAAEAFTPFLIEAVAREAVADLAEALKAAIDEGDAGRIRMRGPETAFRRLADLMGDKADLLDFEESAELDLTAEMGTSVLVTRLSAFAAGLEKAME